MKYLKYSFLFIVLLAPFSANAEVFTKNLSFGLQKDQEVVKLQEFLSDEGLYGGPITGSYYTLTQEAVKKFQIKEGILPASGYFGPLTRQKASAKQSNQITITTTNSPAPNTNQQNQTISDLQFRIGLLLQEIAGLKQKIVTLEQQLKDQQVLGAQISKIDAINAVKKEYGLKINDAQNKMLELQTLQQQKSKIWEHFRYDGRSVDYLSVADSLYKKKIISGIFEKFPYEGCTKILNNQDIFCEGIVEKITNSEIKSLNDQIPYIQNEMDRKVLELQ